MYEGFGHAPRGVTRRSGRIANQTSRLSASEEFATKFRQRPTTQPRVIGFDNLSMRPPEKVLVRGVYGFFPPVKLRNGSGTSSKTSLSSRRSQDIQLEGPSMELVPQETQSLPAPSVASRSKSGKSRKSSKSADAGLTHEPTVVSPRMRDNEDDKDNKEPAQSSIPHLPPTPAADQTAKRVYPNIVDPVNKPFSDLSFLPRPKKMTNRNNSPWVYRFKIKKGMNQLTKLMSSKTPGMMTVTNSTTPRTPRTPRTGKSET
ncbi:unnamed protein product [Owenia fusiformis]|uniref:Uncharacterized protein n=1 Tax=Owenia fusiformis TaxID=6347 RepID=A0A8J1Y033_OWEFU|nr:unnamed protein product [Owenia fusiformis]